MQRLRAIFAAALSVTLANAPLMGAPTATVWGTVATAERAHVDDGVASVGTTVFGGDRLSTEDQGRVQIRAGAARLLLLSASSATVNASWDGDIFNRHVHGIPVEGSNSRAIRRTDNWQVRLLNAKELLVTSKRGPLSVTVYIETQVIEDGKAYHVYLDPDMAAAQGPAGSDPAAKVDRH